MGCDIYITGKVETIHGAIKAEITIYLGQFWQLTGGMLRAEPYKVKVLKQGTSCTTMDSLRYCQYIQP